MEQSPMEKIEDVLAVDRNLLAVARSSLQLRSFTGGEVCAVLDRVYRKYRHFGADLYGLRDSCVFQVDLPEDRLVGEVGRDADVDDFCVYKGEAYAWKKGEMLAVRAPSRGLSSSFRSGDVLLYDEGALYQYRDGQVARVCLDSLEESVYIEGLPKTTALACTEEVFVTGHSSGEIRVMDRKTGASRKYHWHPFYITHLVALDGGLIISASIDGSIFLYNAREGKRNFLLRPPSPIRKIVRGGEGHMAVLCEGLLLTYDLAAKSVTSALYTAGDFRIFSPTRGPAAYAGRLEAELERSEASRAVPVFEDRADKKSLALPNLVAEGSENRVVTEEGAAACAHNIVAFFSPKHGTYKAFAETGKLHGLWVMENYVVTAVDALDEKNFLCERVGRPNAREKESGRHVYKMLRIEHSEFVLEARSPLGLDPKSITDMALRGRLEVLALLGTGDVLAVDMQSKRVRKVASGVLSLQARARGDTYLLKTDGVFGLDNRAYLRGDISAIALCDRKSLLYYCRGARVYSRDLSRGAEDPGEDKLVASLDAQAKIRKILPFDSGLLGIVTEGGGKHKVAVLGGGEALLERECEERPVHILDGSGSYVSESGRFFAAQSR